MEVGLIAGISAFTGILFSFPAPFLYLFATDAWQIGIIRFYHGLATAVFGPVAMAYVADLYQGSRGKNMGWFSTATLLGRFSALALGGIVLAASATEGTFGFTALYVVCGIAGMIAFLAMYLLPASPKSESVQIASINRVGFRKGAIELISDTKIMITCGVEAAILFAYGIFETFLPLRDINVGLSAWEIGMGISSQILTIAVSKPVLGRLSDRYGRPIQIIWGTLLAGGCLLLMAFSFSFLTLLVSSIFLGLSISIVTSASAAHIADLSKNDSHGSAMAILGSLMDIGHTIGPIVGGILAVFCGLTVSFVSGTVVLLCSVFCFIYFFHQKE